MSRLGNVTFSSTCVLLQQTIQERNKPKEEEEETVEMDFFT